MQTSKIIALAAIFLIMGELVEIQYQEVPIGGYIEQLAIIVVDNGINQPYRVLCPNCTATADILDANKRILWNDLNMTQPQTLGRFAIRADSRFEVGNKYILLANVTSPDYGSEQVESAFKITGEAGTAITDAVVTEEGTFCIPPDFTVTDPITDALTYIRYFFTYEGFKCIVVDQLAGNVGTGLSGIYSTLSGAAETIKDLISVVFIDDDSLVKDPAAFTVNRLIPWISGILWGIFAIAAPFIMALECVILLYAFITHKDTFKALFLALEVNIRIITYIIDSLATLAVNIGTAVLGVL